MTEAGSSGEAPRSSPLDNVLETLQGLIEKRHAEAMRTEQGDEAVPLLEDVVVPGDPDLIEEALAGAQTQRHDVEPVQADRLLVAIADIVEQRIRRAGEEARASIMRELRVHLDVALRAGEGESDAVARAVPLAGFPFQLLDEVTRPASPDGSTAPEPAAAEAELEMNEDVRRMPIQPTAPAPEADTEASLAKTYDPRRIETAWYATWEQRGYFRPAAHGRPYCIMLPPPNVTGSLHMGHAFQDTLMDALVRYQRMRGRNTLWQCGTDHAGIATQMVVERQIGERGLTRHMLGRERFVAEIWRWKETSGGNITRQLRRMGASMDWTRERFTLDEGLSRAVTEVFVRLYDEGLIYRGKRLVNWDPVLHTAISDLEVVSEEENGSLWHIRYPLTDGGGHVTVATTRPETLLGDTAVAVHPDDERYRSLVGRHVRLPLTDRTIPIIADGYVDPGFGSGCVKITPAHDFNDHAIGLRHGLEMINVLTPDAAINDAAPVAYRGLDRFEARKRVVADLDALGLLATVEARRIMVPRGDRSHAVIEPYLTDQWFVRAEPLAAPAIRAVELGQIRFVPENWSRTYFEWMRNIQDWCISRQLWWGHRIPAWYDEAGQVYVERTEAEVRTRYGLAPDVRLERDLDVLDTWFSSALWPFSTLGWPDETPELRAFYPTSVLVSGFDIIFFWVARMIMMGLKFTGQPPFREVYIHGLVRDQDGQKMSKSKGNILDPIDLIDGIELEALVAKRTQGLMRPQDAPRIEAATRRQFADGIEGYGTDALRFTFAALASHGRDIKFDLGRIEGYRNFCNKLWNAARYVLMSRAPVDPGEQQGVVQIGLAERWIEARLDAATREVTSGFSSYRFDLAAQAIYSFAWDEYCDWYLELSKTVLTDEGASDAQKRGTRRTLITTLERLLRLAHPIIPFITEEIWQRVAPLAGRTGATIMLEPFPEPDPEREDEGAMREIEWIKTFVLGVRRIRAEMNIAPGRLLPVYTRGGSPLERLWLTNDRRYLTGLARISDLRDLGSGDAPESATALAGGVTLLVPLSDLIDPAAEAERLGRELERITQERARLEAKLANSSFVERAPAEIVARERQRYAELGAALTRLEEQRARIDALRRR